MRSVLAAVLALAAAPAMAPAATFNGASDGEFAGQRAEVLGEQERPTRVAAHAGTVAWMRPGSRGARLMVRPPGGPVRAIARTRSALSLEFDVGPARGGGTAVVYSRCRVRLRDCDLYLQRVGEWEERRIRGVSSRRYSELRPAIWGNRLAFVRIANGGRGEAGRSFIRIHLGRVDGSARLRRLPGGPLGDLPFSPQGFGVEGLDLGPRGVVFTWRSLRGGQNRYTVLLDGLRGGQRRIADGFVPPSGGGSFFHSASLSGHTVSWLEWSTPPQGSESFRLWHLDLASGLRSHAELPCAPHSAAADGAAFAFVHGDAGCPGVAPGTPPSYEVIYARSSR